MAKFNEQATIKTQNKCGHAAYAMPPEERLVTQVLTSFFNEEKYYGDNSEEIIATAKEVIEKDAAFASRLAVFARNEFNMRSISHVLTALLANSNAGKPYVAQTITHIVQRGDDITEILSCYLSMFGKPIPNALRKAIAKAIKRFDEYALAKYKGAGKALKMRDAIILCHPKPDTKEQSEMWKRCIEGKLEIPVTWETELSANGNTREVWERLIDSGKVGYMALLRNLRNIIQAKPNNIGKVYEKISDADAVKKSRQLPFRFLSAYKSIAPIADRKAVAALEKAVDAAVENLPKLPGKTVIAIDDSGSMSTEISRNSSVRCNEIAVLLGMIANRICEDATVYFFSDRLQQQVIPEKVPILYATTNKPFCGGGTHLELPFVEMMHNDVKADRIIILSDNECNGPGFWSKGTIQQLADRYRRQTGNDIWVHAIDLMGYGTQQFHGPKTNIIAGWSEKVFDFILLAEQGKGALIQKIKEYYPDGMDGEIE